MRRGLTGGHECGESERRVEGSPKSGAFGDLGAAARAMMLAQAPPVEGSGLP